MFEFKFLQVSIWVFANDIFHVISEALNTAPMFTKMIKDSKSAYFLAERSLSLEDIIMMQQDEPS